MVRKGGRTRVRGDGDMEQEDVQTVSSEGELRAKKSEANIFRRRRSGGVAVDAAAGYVVTR